VANDHTFPGNFRRFAALAVKETSVVRCQYTLLLLLLLLLPVNTKKQTMQLNQKGEMELSHTDMMVKRMVRM
jgi:hypothetical protein